MVLKEEKEFTVISHAVKECNYHYAVAERLESSLQSGKNEGSTPLKTMAVLKVSALRIM